MASRLGDDPKTVLATYARLLPSSDEVGCGAVQNSWFSPAKISLTESSVKIRRIESASV